jgi:hypothetical protein
VICIGDVGEIALRVGFPEPVTGRSLEIAQQQRNRLVLLRDPRLISHTRGNISIASKDIGEECQEINDHERQEGLRGWHGAES